MYLMTLFSAYWSVAKFQRQWAGHVSKDWWTLRWEPKTLKCWQPAHQKSKCWLLHTMWMDNIKRGVGGLRRCCSIGDHDTSIMSSCRYSSAETMLISPSYTNTGRPSLYFLIHNSKLPNYPLCIDQFASAVKVIVKSGT